MTYRSGRHTRSVVSRLHDLLWCRASLLGFTLSRYWDYCATTNDDNGTRGQTEEVLRKSSYRGVFVAVSLILDLSVSSYLLLIRATTR